MMMNQPKTPQIFIAHASEDKPQVRGLYKRLLQNGFDPWLDEEKLLPGQNWRDEIPEVIRNSDFFIACLSSQSVSKRGYIQREFKQALILLSEKPAGAIYLIPLKLDDCEIPDLRQNEYGINLRDYQWVNYWEDNGHEKLVMSIKYEWEKQGNFLPESNLNSSSENINQGQMGVLKQRQLERLQEKYYQLDQEIKELLEIISQLRSEYNFTASATQKIELERNIESRETRLQQCEKDLKSLVEEINALEK